MGFTKTVHTAMHRNHQLALSGSKAIEDSDETLGKVWTCRGPAPMTDHQTQTSEALSFNRRLCTVCPKRRLYYHMKSLKFADLSYQQHLFEPVIHHLFEQRVEPGVAAALIQVSKHLHGIVDQYLNMAKHIYPTSQQLHAWFMKTSCQYMDPLWKLPMLPVRGRWSASFDVCTRCGETGASHMQRVYDTRGQTHYSSLLCCQCSHLDLITDIDAGDNVMPVVLFERCTCVFNSFQHMIEEYTFTAQYIARQVFLNQKTNDHKTITQFSLHRSDGFKMVIGLDTHLFKKCVAPAKFTYEFREVTDILLLAHHGRLLSGKTRTSRQPGSVIWELVLGYRNGFSKKIKKGECYHNIRLGPDWALYYCRPCWQRQKYKCICDHDSGALCDAA